MIAINPNLRALKPLSKYLEKRVRMNGRQRLANEQSTSGNNIRRVKLSFVPFGSETLEIYHDGSRLFDGWRILGPQYDPISQTTSIAEVEFDPAINGRLDFIDDTTWIDYSQKWLQVDIVNLLHPDDLANTAFGTDRREEHNVATFCTPVVITQGGIGFCRLSDDRKSLLYSSYYGHFGRDSITYAIRADNGQLSDYRCIDIRVRNPNFVPEMRMGIADNKGRFFRLNGEVKQGEVGNAFKVVDFVPTGGTIELPNKDKEDAVTQYHLIFQGKDEDGEWYHFSEFFEPDQYEFAFDRENPDYAVRYEGIADALGIVNSNVVTLDCSQTDSSRLTFTIKFLEKEIFRATLNGRGTSEVETVARSLEPGHSIAFNPDPNNVNPFVDWTPTEQVTAEGLTVDSVFSSPTTGNHQVEVDFKGQISIKTYWNPVESKETQTLFDISKKYRGTFHVTPNHESDDVHADVDPLVIMPRQFVWTTDDPFSKQIILPEILYTYTNNWRIE